MTSQDKCQSLLLNVINDFLGTNSDGISKAPELRFRRLFEMIERCKSVENLDEHKLSVLETIEASYTERLENEDAKALKNIRTFKANDLQRNLALDTLDHYRTYTPVWCSQCLTWKNYLYYHLILRPEHSAVALGAATILFGAYRSNRVARREAKDIFNKSSK